MRRHVMELRDLANHALKEGEEPRGWDVYCDPLLRRCGLLLQVSPMCKAPPGVAGRAEAGGDGGGLQQASPAAKIHAVHEAMRGHLRKSSQVVPSPPTCTRL
jgi:hypothetical protein